MQWYRWYGDMHRDPKIRALTPEGRWLWATLLDLACEADADGLVRIAHGVPHTVDSLADEARIPAETVEPALDMMQRLGMIQQADDGITIVNWMKRQYKGDTSTARVKAHRERKRAVSINETLPKRSTPVSETAPDTESDTDTEIPIDDDDNAHGCEEKTDPEPETNAARSECLELVNRSRPDWVLSGERYREFLSYEDKLPWEVIRAAVDRTLTAGAKDLKYLLAILASYAERGIRTIAEVEALDAAHEANKARKARASPSKGGKAPAKSNVFLQRGKKDAHYYDGIYKQFGGDSP